jgi:hypothetical protein
MKLKFLPIVAFFLYISSAFCQENSDAAILKILLTKYYANEKVIVKGRLQLLSFYCKKAPNNEETLEVISKSKLLKENSKEIKSQIIVSLDEDWSKEFNTLFSKEHKYLKSKVNNCLSLEEFQAVSKRFNDNNQRLMIVNKPIYFAKKYCLVKVAFYRNIEHNSGRYFLFENVNGTWIIKETLNEWET